MRLLFKNNSFYTSVVIGYIIICILQSFAFAQTDNTFYSRTIGWIYRPIILLIMVFLFVRENKKKLFSFNRASLFLAISVTVNWLFDFVHSYGEMNIFSLLGTFVLLLFCFSDDIIKAKTFRTFHSMIVIMSAFGILISVLYTLKIIGPYSMVDYYDSEPGYNDYYANYIVGYIYVNPLGITRLCGLFNEPGLFGTIGALTLIADGCKQTKQNILIFVACVLTLSTAFFVLILLYFVLNAILKGNYKSIIVLISLMFLLGFVISKTDNENLVYLIERTTVDEGGMKANQRVSVDLDNIWTRVVNDSEKLFWGYGQKLPQMESSSSWKILVVKHGIIGCIMFLFPLLLGVISMKGFSKNVFILLLLFFLSIYQRPLIFYLIYFVILVGGSQHIRFNEDNTCFEQIKD